MNILIKQTTLINPISQHHSKVVDILIEKGIISQIKKIIPNEKNYKTIEANGLYTSIGWIDMQVNFCDSGNEHKETLETGLKASAKGGFTGVCVMSGTNPPMHNKAQIEYIKNKTKDGLVDVYPIGTVSYNQEGKDIAEMYDMQKSGAVAFSDYKKTIKDAGLILRALQYSANINSFIITHCDDKTISHDGQMNEGVVSTKLGLKGMPALAEELMLQRNIQILEYAGGKMHIPSISTKGSVELIKKAKAKKLNITCGVAAYNLLLDETELIGFDTNYKVSPPLRTKEDIDALKKGIIDGTIDVVVSDHNPQDIESKDLEFDLADFGMIGTQIAFNVLLTAIPKIAAEKLVEVISTNARKVLGLNDVTIKEGEPANLTLFTLEGTTVIAEKENASKSKNTPLFGKTLNGKVVCVINNNSIV
jgi:dihydroorotase